MTQFLDFVAVGVRLRGIAKIAEMLILWLRASIVCWARVSGILKAAEGDDFVVKKRSLANHRWTPCWKWVSMGVRPHSLGKPIEWKLSIFTTEQNGQGLLVPTRWGNQLNGN